jgi:hypothetical protein
VTLVITIMVLELRVPEGTDLAALRPILPSLLTHLATQAGLERLHTPERALPGGDAGLGSIRSYQRRPPESVNERVRTADRYIEGKIKPRGDRQAP